jgi:cysteine desulfurase
MRTYLDHAATTPLRPEAAEAMAAEFGRLGNPSSLHASGRAARRVVEEAREVVAAALGAQPSEVIFTSGGTEADNLAIKGAFWASRVKGRDGVVTSTTEHHAVGDAVAWLERSAGARVTWVPVDPDARVDLEAVSAAVDARTALVSVIWGNNEVGALNPVTAIAGLARAAGALSHSDAVQVAGHLPVDFRATGLDLMTVTAHKLGGPVGIGALLARREVVLEPLLHGGGQERDVRSGTLDALAAAGFAAALQAAVSELAEEAERTRNLRRRLIEAVASVVPDVIVHGPDSTHCLPGIVNLRIPGVLAEALLLLLDQAGVDCSAGAACSAGVTQVSHVLLALGLDEPAARSTVRFSLGRTTTAEDVERLRVVLPEAVRRARAAAAYA